jgi:hypothetical protein
LSIETFLNHEGKRNLLPYGCTIRSENVMPASVVVTRKTPPKSWGVITVSRLPAGTLLAKSSRLRRKGSERV